MTLWMGRESYDDGAKAWLARSGHYLENPPPGCILCIVVRDGGGRTLFGECAHDGPRLGMCLVGRPVARLLPQDGSVGEVTRMFLVEGLPHGTASATLRCAALHAKARGMSALIAYHDRTRHTGCIYRKAGFRRDGVTAPSERHGWGSRSGRTSAALVGTPKRRWRLDLVEVSR